MEEEEEEVHVPHDAPLGQSTLLLGSRNPRVPFLAFGPSDGFLVGVLPRLLEDEKVVVVFVTVVCVCLSWRWRWRWRWRCVGDNMARRRVRLGRHICLNYDWCLTVN